MTGDARKERSKRDSKEGPPDIVEISEDESLLDISMHLGSAGHKHQQTNGFNKDIKGRQSKASSERSQPPRMVDEDHNNNNNNWHRTGLGKAGNQDMNRYADDRRRGDGWGTGLSRSPPSSRGDWNRSHRNISRSRSRSRNRSRSRGRGRGRSRSRSRSISPYFTDRGSEWRFERTRALGGLALLCRDFVAGGCRRGSYCRFPHEDGLHRQFDEHYPLDSRESYWHRNKEFMYSREPRGGHYDKGSWERSEPRREYPSMGQCYNIVKGRCNRGASCQYVHDDSAPHGGWRDEVRGSGHGRGGLDSSYAIRTDQRGVKPCKFFAEGRCRHGQSCRYLHEEAPPSQMGLAAPDMPLNYSDERTARGNYSNWGAQSNAAPAGSEILSRDVKENPVSQGTRRSNSPDEYKNWHLKDAGKNQSQKSPPKDFASQRQNNHEVAASKQPEFSTPIETSVDSMANDKISGTEGQSRSATTCHLSMPTGMNGANVTGVQNLDQTAQNQDSIPQNSGAQILSVTTQSQNTTPSSPLNSPMQRTGISLHPDRQDQCVIPQAAIPQIVVPTSPITSQLQNVAPSLPLNSQMQQNDFLLHSNRQGQFVVPQAAANNSAPSMQRQPVAPYVRHNQANYILGSQALPDLSALNGDYFNVVRQVPQNQPSVLHVAQSPETVDIPKLNQDRGYQSIQRTHNFQPVTPKDQTPLQNLQGLSVLPSSISADIVGALVSHNAATNEEALRSITVSLAHYCYGNTPLTTDTFGLQLSRPNPNLSLMNNSSAGLPEVQPNPGPWAQQRAGVFQPAHSFPTEQPAPHAFQAPVVAGSTNGNSMVLPHLVAPTGPTATLAVNGAIPSEIKKEEPKDTDAEAHGDDENKKSKDSKALKMFKLALADFVKDALKPTWKEGQLTRELHKTIVKKVVDKVASTVENTPETREKIDIYMSYSREKLNKLVQAYVGKHVKT